MMRLKAVSWLAFVLCSGCSSGTSAEGAREGGAEPGGGGASASSGGGTGAGGPPASGGGTSGGTTGSGGLNASTGGTGGASGGGGSGGVTQSNTGGSGGKTSAGCTGSTYLLCEDFEATAVGATPAGWTKHGDQSGVASDEFKHGAHSLRLGAIPTWERRIYHDVPAALGGAHWGRIYYKVQLPVPDAFVHSTIVAFSGVGPVNGPSEFRVVDTVKQAKTDGSHHQFLYNVQPQNSNPEFGTGTSYDYTFDGAWHCAEWHIDASKQEYEFYFDSATDPKIQFTKGAGKYDGSDLPPSFEQIKIGWINYQNSPPGFVAWVDDLALDHTRIGCD
ncbi:MAG TPA: hypothetical protein VF395_06730 [Polyangiaceae bacterium]